MCTFYYDFVVKEIRFYDLQSRANKIVSKQINLQSHPVLIQNEKYLAYFEVEPWGKLPKAKLQVMSVDGWVKREIVNPKRGESPYYINQRVSDTLWGK